MKKTLLCISIFILLLSFIEGITLFTLSKESKRLEVKMDNESVVSLYSIVGDKKLVNYSDGYETDGTRIKKYTYKTSLVSRDDILTYIAKLKELGYVYTEKTNMDVKEFGKKSDKDDTSILINITYDSSGKYVYIKYIKIKGSFQRSEKYY